MKNKTFPLECLEIKQEKLQICQNIKLMTVKNDFTKSTENSL